MLMGLPPARIPIAIYRMMDCNWLSIDFISFDRFPHYPIVRVPTHAGHMEGDYAKLEAKLIPYV